MDVEELKGKIEAAGEFSDELRALIEKYLIDSNKVDKEWVAMMLQQASFKILFAYNQARLDAKRKKDREGGFCE